MHTDTTVNGSTYVTLDDALDGAQTPSLHSPFSVPFIGILKPDGAGSESNTVRLYPPDGSGNRYFLIRKSDVDPDHIQLLRPEVVADRGWIADKIVRIRVRPIAQVIAVSATIVEARKLPEVDIPTLTGNPCKGTFCEAPYVCTMGGNGAHVCSAVGKTPVPCPNCVL